MDDQKKKIKELNDKDVDRPSYKALFCIESIKAVFVLLLLFVVWTVAKTIYYSVLGAISPDSAVVEEQVNGISR